MKGLDMSISEKPRLKKIKTRLITIKAHQEVQCFLLLRAHLLITSKG
jgi:hypothetical protein